MKPERLIQYQALRSARLSGTAKLSEVVRDREFLIEMVDELLRERVDRKPVRPADMTGKPVLIEVPGAEVRKDGS